MKKIYLVLIFVLTLSFFATSSFAKQTKTPKYFKTIYTIKVDGKKVSLGNAPVLKIGSTMMVPLRPTADALGFKLGFDKKTQTISITGQYMSADIIAGVNEYIAYNTDTKEKTQTKKLGVAPTIIKGITYVPADFYNILLKDDIAVNIKEHTVYIKKDESKQNVQIKNPLVDYTSFDDAKKSIGYDFLYPTSLPKDYKIEKITIIDNEIVQIKYLKDHRDIVYRTSKNLDDISGDYNEYEEVKKIKLDNPDSSDAIIITTRGNNGFIKSAIWTKNNDMSFSLMFYDEVNEDTLIDIIKSLK